jgi:DNA recombination protein RmuC
VDIGKFKDEFDVLGSHVQNAASKYQDASKRLEKFSDRLLNIQDTKQIEKS